MIRRRRMLGDAQRVISFCARVVVTPFSDALGDDTNVDGYLLEGQVSSVPHCHSKFT